MSKQPTKERSIGNNERFIAGAVCPACKALDRIVVGVLDDGTERQRCVSCGHDQAGRPSESTPPGSRLTRREGGPSEAVRIVDPTDP